MLHYYFKPSTNSQTKINVEKLPEWNNYSNETVEEVKRDKKERPPLTGEKRYIPNGLYDEPWDKVGEAHFIRTPAYFFKTKYWCGKKAKSGNSGLLSSNRFFGSYASLVRPFHGYAEYSEFPAVLVREVLE